MLSHFEATPLQAVLAAHAGPMHERHPLAEMFVHAGGGGAAPAPQPSPLHRALALHHAASHVPLHGAAGIRGGGEGFVRMAIDQLHKAAQAEHDEGQIKTIMSSISALQGILASNQKAQR